MCKNLVKELLNEKGYTCSTDNRNYHTKCLNKILEQNVLDIKISTRGKDFVNNQIIDEKGNPLRYTFCVSAYGYIRRSYIRPRYMNAKQMLTVIGKFLKDEIIQEKHKSSMSVVLGEIVECSKCNGTGFIMQFAHVCEGVCFDCYGHGKVYKSFKQEM